MVGVRQIVVDSGAVFTRPPGEVVPGLVELEVAVPRS